MPGGKTETEADSSLGLRRRRRAARLDILTVLQSVAKPPIEAKTAGKRGRGVDFDLKVLIKWE